MENQFKVGDVVYLNADKKQKVPMTVESVSKDEIICKWITSFKVQTCGFFDPRMLYSPEKTHKT